MITLKNRALNSLSNIEIELKRRTDLIPKIVDLVKNFAEHEKIQKIITEIRKEIIYSSILPYLEKKFLPLYYFL